MCSNPLEQNNDIITGGVTEQTARKVTWENTERVWTLMASNSCSSITIARLGERCVKVVYSILSLCHNMSLSLRGRSSCRPFENYLKACLCSVTGPFMTTEFQPMAANT